MAIELKKTEVTMDRPIYSGASILDISKVSYKIISFKEKKINFINLILQVHMYDFYYNFLQKLIGDRLNLHYIDTDSFVVSCPIDVYKLIKENISRFDTSEYEENNVYGIPRKNGGFLGYFKDETRGRIIKLFIGRYAL